MGRDDWKNQLANKFGREVPKEEKKEIDWAQQYNSLSRNNRNTRNNNRSGNYNQNRNNQGNRSGNTSGAGAGSGLMATAPYNFVTLPDMIVPSPLDQNLDWSGMDEKERRAKFKEYILQSGKLSGRLELELEAVTPVFIGGNGESFFAPNGVPVIPGSTLRGLTKNLLKIITCGAMRRNEDFYDHHLYFRDFASRSKALRENYKKRMVEMVTVTQPDGKNAVKPRTKASPGFLIRIAGNYYMCPAQAQIVFDPRKCNKGEGIQWYDKGEADIFTGYMNSKKTYVHIKEPVWDEEKRIPVPKEVVEEYRADKNRDGLDLFEKGKKGAAAGGFAKQKEVDFVAPCYYVAQDGVVQHFGHGRYYRIAYENSIGDHVPETMQKPVVDFADAMFGSKELWAGRVYFEEAPLVGSPEFLDRDYSHPLMTPSPTSFQMYLKQTGSPAKHWDTDAELRGYKLYWHQNIRKYDWKLDETKDKKVSGMKRIEPLGKGSCFKGCIRFSQLSEIELGALCSVFHLDKNGEDIVYKIGQGKSIGMGSVRIKARLFVEDAASRYSCLFQGARWNDGMRETDDTVYRQTFAAYQDKMLGQHRKRFDVGMSELRTMLDWKHTAQKDWNEKTAMMNPTVKGDNRLKDRIPLDDALTFVTKSYRK